MMVNSRALTLGLKPVWLLQLKRKYWYMPLWHISRPSVVYPSARL